MLFVSRTTKTQLKPASFVMTSTISPLSTEDLLSLAKRCGALYICPKRNGVHLGPLVAYTGKGNDNKRRVGEVYINFRMLEQHMPVVTTFAENLRLDLVGEGLFFSFDTVCGVPSGGRTLGQELARVTSRRFVYPEKIKAPVCSGVSTESGGESKQRHSWSLDDFSFRPGERVAIVDDVFNSFSSTDGVITALRAVGAQVTVLVSAFNRSTLVHDGMYKGIPVQSAIHMPYESWSQNSLTVLGDMNVNNVEWDPKTNWNRLMEVMARHVESAQ